MKDGDGRTCGGIKSNSKGWKCGGMLVEELNQLQRMDG